MTVYFIRHGYVHNPKDVFYGRLPGFPLSEEGVRCIEYMGEQLKDKNITAIYHSPILRGVQTAETLAKIIPVPLTPDARLVEIDTAYEGMTNRPHMHFPVSPEEGVESIEQIYSRMADFLRETVASHDSGAVIAVSHGGPIRILEMGLLGQPFNDHGYRSQSVPDCGTGLIVRYENGEFTAERLT